MTNTAISDAWESEPYGEASKCYGAYVDGKWVDGCAKGDIIQQGLLEKLKADTPTEEE